MHGDPVVEEETGLGFCLYEPQVKHSFGGLETDFFPEVVDWLSKKTRQNNRQTINSYCKIQKCSSRIPNPCSKTGYLDR